MYGPRQILMKLDFLRQIFLRMLKYPVTKNIRPVRADLFYAGGRADRQIDVTKLIIVFLNFANAPKNDTKVSTYDKDIDWIKKNSV